MLVTIDVGNTQTVMGLFDGDDLVDQWRLSTVRERTADEYRLFFEGLLRQDGHRLDRVGGVALSSVVPEAKEALTAMAHEMVDGPVLVIGPGVKTGMAINIDSPREVGADRVVNAVAAQARYGTPVISVDFGTSTNFDVVDADGAYIGGSIAPGLAVSEDALIAATAALRRVEIVEPRAAIGRSTVEAMQSGLIYGHAGLVDGIMERLALEVGGNPARVATGGLASTIVPHCRSVEIVDDRLTLDGLRLIFERNMGDEA
ncbi:MAG: type III pantothenate kinase [Actinobacteria bacterium]|jgi:type III pantothenate kinase|nr:type III pantothenate kinase [Actinomycetota bacterium]MBU1494536.1 type III pantothenate kinase [Actinomycetota bacterium]